MIWPEWDQQFFFLIHELEFPGFFEQILVYARNKYTWIPLYAIWIGLLVARTKTRIWIYLLGVVACVAISDGVSSQLIKPTVKRLRPCKAMQEQVDERVTCGSGYSFPSAHATNHFALAFLLILFFRPLRLLYKGLLLFWAGLISFSQVYVGVHYPIDILTGALIGATIGYLIGRIVLLLDEKLSL